MRSAVLAGLLVLAGCNSETRSDDKVENHPITDGPTTAESEDASSAASATTSAVPSPPTASASATPAAPPLFQALGTEPFWSLTVGPGKLTYSSPEVPKGITFDSAAQQAGQAWRFTGALQGKPVKLTITPGKCSDGMSDTEYAYAAVFIWGDRTEQGCARLK